jgi:hypothetical protein
MDASRSARLLFAAWVLLLAVLFLTTPTPAAAQDEPLTLTMPGGVVAQVSFTDQDDLQRLVAQYDIWHVDHTAGEVTLWLTAADLQRLQVQPRQITIDHKATGNLLAAQAAVQTAANDSGIPGFACYRTVEETHASMAQLAQEFPILVQEVVLGESWEFQRSGGASGYAIPGIVLTNQATPGPKPIFFLMAAIHAREYTTAETAMRFAEHLVRSYGSDADATWLLDYTEIHVVPQANPDGRKRAEGRLLWRKNTNNDLCGFDALSYGVDLNRNSSFKWAQCTGHDCSSADACSPVYRGVSAASEPEVQALEAYMRTIFPDMRGPLDSDAAPADATGVMVSLHSYFPKIFFPWGWTQTPAPNGAALQTLARKFGYYTGYPACQSGAPGCIYMTDGTTDDFAYGELGVAAFTFELGYTFFEPCADFESKIITPTLASLTYAAKAAILPYRAPSGPEVIDVSLSVSGVIAAGQIVTLTATADDNRFYSGGYGIESVQSIQAMRYSVGQPSWITGTVSAPMTPTDGIFTKPVEPAFAHIDTKLWPTGQHIVFVEAQDADGVWGVPTAIFLTIGERRYLPFVLGGEGRHTE